MKNPARGPELENPPKLKDPKPCPGDPQGDGVGWRCDRAPTPCKPNVYLMTGRLDAVRNVENSIWEALGYHQNIFEIGGKGTLRGYNWKEFSSSHFQLTTLELWIGFIGVFYDRAVLFESSGNVFNAEYFSDLSSNISNDVYDSMGLSFGRKKFRLSFAQKLKDPQGSVIYLTFGTPLQY